MHKKGTIHTMLKLIVLVKPLTLHMILAVILGVTGFLCAIFIPYFAALIISHVMINAPDFPVNVFFIMIVVFAILRGILHYGEQACNHYIAFKLLAILRDKVFKALRRLAPAKLEGKDSGDLVYLITSDIEALEVFYAHTISPILIAIVTSIILLFQFQSMHIYFVWIALCAYVAVGVVIPIYISKRGKCDGEDAKEAFKDMSSHTLESLRNMQDILQYQHGKQRLGEMHEKSQRVNHLQQRLKRHEGWSSSLSNVAVCLFSLCMFLVGTYLYSKGEITSTSLLMSTVLMLSSFGPVLALSALSNHLLITMASAKRVLQLLEEKEVVKEVVNKGNVTFDDIHIKNVNFAYDQELILHNVAYTFEKGSITGILGKSGSGKSTLLKLMMRFFPTTKGDICIGNTSLNEINTNNLRSMQGYVTQDTILFQDTIFNNVHIANLNASVSDVERACKQANIHEFIMSLPNEYATTLTELGDSLSGGEKQRIALARAFLHDCDCILLDEPTSNLDALNEAIILKSLKQQKEKTMILVSHRPQTLKIANRIIEMESGRVS